MDSYALIFAKYLGIKMCSVHVLLISFAANKRRTNLVTILRQKSSLMELCDSFSELQHARWHYTPIQSSRMGLNQGSKLAMKSRNDALEKICAILRRLEMSEQEVQDCPGSVKCRHILNGKLYFHV
jgi:hypothetical protein